MRWNQSTKNGQRFRSGRSAWTSAGAPQCGSWRWHARPYSGLLIESCPLADVCVVRRDPRPDAAPPSQEAGRASAGSQSGQTASDVLIGFWFGRDDRKPD